MDNDEFIRMLAAWALVHETADEGYKAAVERGRAQEPGEMVEDPQAFVDGLAAAIAEEKERLKVELASGKASPPGSRSEVASKLDEISFEIAELRGRIESMQSSIDALRDEDEPER